MRLDDVAHIRARFREKLFGGFEGIVGFQNAPDFDISDTTQHGAILYFKRAGKRVNPRNRIRAERAVSCAIS